MKAKLALVVGAGAGYVLGTRARRERYNQIKDLAQSAWADRRVQKTVEAAKEQAGDAA